MLKNLPWDLVASLTAQYVERAPRAAELLSRGVHEATGTFDIGNPNLKIESRQPIEAGLRRAKGPFRFEATGYYTRYSTASSSASSPARPATRTFDSCGDPVRGPAAPQPGGLFPARRNLPRRRVPEPVRRGAAVGRHLGHRRTSIDTVRATFTDGTNVPRIPPVRLGGGLFWRDANWLARVNLLHAFAQKGSRRSRNADRRLQPAQGRGQLPLAAPANDLGAARAQVGVVGNNLLNDDIRNSVSFTKDEVLMPGRSVRVFATVKN